MKRTQKKNTRNMTKYNSTYLYSFVATCLLLLFIAPIATHAQSAGLSISPASGVYPVGEPFTVDVRIDTGGAEVNVVNATIAYNPSDMRYESVSGNGSVFSQVISDSETDYGKVSISAIGKGGQVYEGSDGLVARLTFIPLRNVASELYFSSGGANSLPLGASVASAANILSSLQAATYNFIPKQRMGAVASFANASESFEITPLPVPDGEWFGTTSVKLSWTVPESATEMRTTVSPNPDKTPDTLYQVPVNSEQIEDLEEGLQYFLLQFGYDGEWGDVIRFPLHVDLTDPNYVIIKEVARSDPSDPHVAFAIESSDDESGIKGYEIGIDGGEQTSWDAPEDSIYEPEDLSPGEHVLTVTAFDKAGNSTSSDAVFLVKSLQSPTLVNESVPDKALTGDTISVQGETYPNADVTVNISHNDGEAKEKTVKSDENGRFTATITEAARAGIYTLWFSVTDERGATSPNSIRRSIEVKQPYIMLFGTVAVTYLSVLVPLLGLIVLLALVLWLGYTWLRGYRGRVRRETNEAHHSTREEFEKLREELIKQIGMLEKANQSRELTREEMRIFTDLSKRLDKIEQRIIQEIEDIETVQVEEEHATREQPVEGSFDRYKKKIAGQGQGIDSSHIVHL